MAFKTFHASTNRHEEWGGPKRWFRIFVYNTVDEMRAAGKYHSPEDKMDWSAPVACYHSPRRWVRDRPGAPWSLTKPKNFGGIIRLSDPWVENEVIVHECMHAAIEVYRMDVKEQLYLSYKTPNDREENLCYMAGNISSAVFEALKEGDV